MFKGDSTELKIHIFCKAQLILNLTFAHSFLVSKNHLMPKNRFLSIVGYSVDYQRIHSEFLHLIFRLVLNAPSENKNNLPFLIILQKIFLPLYN